MYRRILGSVYKNEIENSGILTNKEIYASVKNPTTIEKIKLKRLRWFRYVYTDWQKIEFPKGYYI